MSRFTGPSILEGLFFVTSFYDASLDWVTDTLREEIGNHDIWNGNHAIFCRGYWWDLLNNFNTTSSYVSSSQERKKMRNTTKKRKDKYQNTPEPLYLDIHFLRIQTLKSAIPSNGVIACSTWTAIFLPCNEFKNWLELPFAFLTLSSNFENVTLT